MRRCAKIYELKRISWRGIFLKVGKSGVKWDITIMVNNIMEQEQIENPDSVFLNPEYLASQNPTKKEDWENLLIDNPDLPRFLVDYVEEQMSDPTRCSSSKIFNFVKDWISNPEKSFIYRNEILFNNASKQMDLSEDKWGSDGWKVEVPIISIGF